MSETYSRPVRELDDDGFAEIVNRDTKGHSTLSEYNMLRMPENVIRWHRELVFMQNDIDVQISQVRLSPDPPEAKAERLLRMRTVLKHVHRNRRFARYTMDQHDLVDLSMGQIIGSMHQLEHLLGDGHIDAGKKLLENVLDRLERRVVADAAHG